MHAEDVAETLRLAAENGIAVVPRSAGTNVGAGFLPAPDRILLDMRSLDRILEIDAEGREAVVQPGILNGALNDRLRPLGLCFSPDPASAPLCSIGGNIAENAGGPHCLKHGVTIHHVESVNCVRPGGETRRFSALDSGPDLLGLLIGSEGTLAIVTEARLRLRALPPVTRTLLAAFDHAEAATAAVSAVIASGVVPAALEYFDRASVALFDSYRPTGYPSDAEAIVLVDVDGTEEEVAEEMDVVERLVLRPAREVRRADGERARAELWRGRLHTGQAVAAQARQYVIGDVTVPRERIPDMDRVAREAASRFNITIFMVGHAGDGNVHPTILYDASRPEEVVAMQGANDAIVTAALEMGGTFTGEHGVGSQKREYMTRRFTPVEIAAMRAVKSAFDRGGILNPGVLLPEPSADEPDVEAFLRAVDAALHGAHVPEPARGGAPVPRAEAPRIDTENLTVAASGEMTLEALQAALDRAGYACPALSGCPDSGATVCEALEAGKELRDALLEVRVVLRGGWPARFGSNAVKDVAGYTMQRLFLGSRGAFGHLDEAILRIRKARAPA